MSTFVLRSVCNSIIFYAASFPFVKCFINFFKILNKPALSALETFQHFDSSFFSNGISVYVALFLQTFVRLCWILNAGYFLLLAKCSYLCLFGTRWIRADIYERPLCLSGIEHGTFTGSASINSILTEKRKKKTQRLRSLQGFLHLMQTHFIVIY